MSHALIAGDKLRSHIQGRAEFAARRNCLNALACFQMRVPRDGQSNPSTAMQRNGPRSDHRVTYGTPGEIQRHPNGYYYLVMERISGKSLQQVLAGRPRMLTRRMLDYCAQMSRIVDDSYTASWAWRNCGRR